jgi:hypothetical protein
LIFVNIGAFVVLPSSAKSEGREKITLIEAYNLAETALSASYYANSPQLHPEEDKGRLDPHFYFFMGIWSNPAPEGSTTAGSFAIQKETGDVWDSVTCEKIEGGALKKIQKLIRRKLRLTAASYEALRRKPPGCE